jgi:hypothetical protein
VKLYRDTVGSRRLDALDPLYDPQAVIPYIHIFALLSLLKQICNHPALLEEDSNDYDRYESGKWELFKELLAESLDSGQKVVVYSQFLKMIAIIEDHLKRQNIDCAVLTGSSRNRGASIRRFNTDPQCRVFVGSLKAGGIGIDLYNEALEQQGKSIQDGDIILGCWAIIAEDPEAEAAKIGEHVLYQINEYIKWGAFGPPESTPLFEDHAVAIENGLYELWDADTAVTELNKLLAAYPNIRDIHFWAQFPGEPVESGDARLRYIAEQVLPRLG